ncbi:hypothetical protein KSP40_PGU015655 [Platanthera guangdongensis]|uniref:Uncharacterized protein n=1 Tax=Platanthera guangdongensis TaxID=2320717 RepID=A0ABR2LQW9_9ASPA
MTDHFKIPKINLNREIPKSRKSPKSRRQPASPSSFSPSPSPSSFVGAPTLPPPPLSSRSDSSSPTPSSASSPASTTTSSSPQPSSASSPDAARLHGPVRALLKLFRMMAESSPLTPDQTHSSYVKEEVIMVLGVEGELQKLQQQMVSIKSLLKDAEKRKLDDADDIIDLCRSEGAQLLLLAGQNHASKPSPVCCGLSSPFPCFRSVPLPREIGNRVKELNDRLAQIYENRKRFKFERINTKQETLNSTPVNSGHTSCLVDEYVVGREVEESANELAQLLLTEEFEEKCLLFALLLGYKQSLSTEVALVTHLAGAQAAPLTDVPAADVLVVPHRYLLT